MVTLLSTQEYHTERTVEEGFKDNIVGFDSGGIRTRKR